MILLSIRDGQFEFAAILLVVFAGFPVGYGYWWLREGRRT
jgi:hypothetical protein